MLNDEKSMQKLMQKRRKNKQTKRQKAFVETKAEKKEKQNAAKTEKNSTEGAGFKRTNYGRRGLVAYTCFCKN